MTATAATLPAPAGASASYERPRVVGDALTIAWRNLLNIRRNPQLLVFATIQPVIFVLMFRYVFGGAIKVPGVSYVDYLMPGIFVQTVVFGSLTTGVGLAEDLQKGLIDRFRSLPMARSAVLIGRTLADLVRNVFVVALMCVVGLIVGWNPSASLPRSSPGSDSSWRSRTRCPGCSPSWASRCATARPPRPRRSRCSPPWSSRRPPSCPSRPCRAGCRCSPSINPCPSSSTPFALTLGGATASNVLSALAWIVGLVVVFAPLAVARYRRAV